MGENKITIELPSYLSIDTVDGLKIEIDNEKYLNSIKTYEIVNNLENRYNYDPLGDADENDLVEELRERCYDFSKELDNDEICDEYYNRKLNTNSSIMDNIFEAAKALAPRQVLDKETIKEVINEFIDINVTHSYR